MTGSGQTADIKGPCQTLLSGPGKDRSLFMKPDRSITGRSLGTGLSEGKQNTSCPNVCVQSDPQSKDTLLAEI